MPDENDNDQKTVIMPHGNAGGGEQASERPQLLCIDAPPGSGTQAGRVYVLTSSGANTIGREAGNNIVLPSDRLSRRHATIHQEDGNWFITDLKSLNGTFVNGTQIDKQTLRSGDQIRLVGITFGFQLGEISRPPSQPDPINVELFEVTPPTAAAPKRNSVFMGVIGAVVIAAIGAYFYFAGK